MVALQITPAVASGDTGCPAVSDHAGIEALPAAALALLEQEGKRRFFNGGGWYRLFCRTCLDPGQRPVVYRVVAGEDASGERGAGGPVQLILPMLAPLGRDGSRIADRPLGPASAMVMTNYQSAYFGPITDASPPVCAHLLRALARHLKQRGATVLDFNHLDSAIPENRLLEPAFADAGFRICSYPDEPIVYEDIAGRSYAGYLGDRSPRLCKNLKRRRAKLEQLGRVGVTIVEGGPGLDAAILDYQAVQQASWKRPEPYPEHVPALIREAAAAGCLRLGLLHLDDRPVATDLTIVAGGLATGKKGHYDETMRRHHAGDLMTAAMLEHLIDVDRVQTIDFGKTAAAYKLKWLASQRPMHAFVAFNPKTAEGQLTRLAYYSRTRLRQHLGELKRKLAPVLPA